MANEDILVKIGTQSDSAGANQAKNDIKGIGDATDDAGEKAKRASFNFKEFAQNAGLGATAILTAAGGIATLAIKSAGEYEQSQIAFTTLLGSAQKAKDAIKQIETDAKVTPFNLPDLIKANQLLISAGVDAKSASKDVLNLGDAISASGGGTPELMRLSANLQQIQAVGKASAMDIRQFGMAGIDIYRMLADTMGVSVEQVKGMDIGYTQLSEAFAKSSAEGGRFHDAMKNQSQSLQGIISNVQDAIGIGLKDIAVNSGLFDLVKAGVQGLLDGITVAIPKIVEFIQAIAGNKEAIMIVVGIIGGLLVAAVSALVIAMAPLLLSALAFAAVGAAIAAGISLLLPYFPMLWAAVEPVFTAITKTITDFIVKHIPAFQAFWDVVKGIFTFALGFIKGFIETTWTGIAQFFKGIWEIITGIFKIGLGLIEIIFGVFQGIFTGNWNKAWGTIKLGFEDVVSGLGSFFKGIFDAIMGYFKTWVNGFVGLVNGIISGINGVMDKIPGAKGVQIPLIPHLASGIENFSGGMALVGEQGPELVRLPRGSDVVPADQTAKMMGGGMSVVNNIYTPIDIDLMLRNLSDAVATA